MMFAQSQRKWLNYNNTVITYQFTEYEERNTSISKLNFYYIFYDNTSILIDSSIHIYNLYVLTYIMIDNSSIS